GPCAWSGRAPGMAVAGGDPVFLRPLAAPQGVVASRAPRRARRTLDDGACEAAKPGNWFRRFLFLAEPQAGTRTQPSMSRRAERQDLGVAVDVLLQLGTGEPEPCRVDEDGGVAGIDHRRLDGPEARHVERIDPVAGREHRPAFALAVAFVGRRVEELEPHL